MKWFRLFKTRRSKKIAPGVRVTLTKKGPGVSVKTPVGSYSTRKRKVTQRKKSKGCGLLLALFVAIISVGIRYLGF